MKLDVARQAICAADDQENDLEMSVDISDEATLAQCISRIQEAKFLQFSSTRSEATGYLNGEAVVRLFENGQQSTSLTLIPLSQGVQMCLPCRSASHRDHFVTPRWIEGELIGIPWSICRAKSAAAVA